MNYLTTAEAAAELGVSYGRVMHLIYAGRIKAEKIGAQWLVRPSALERARNRKPGRPRKKT